MSELNRFVLRPLLNVFTDCDILSSSGLLFQRTIIKAASPYVSF